MSAITRNKQKLIEKSVEEAERFPEKAKEVLSILKEEK